MRHKNLLMGLAFVALIFGMIFLPDADAHKKTKLVQETYIVEQGDNLWDISRKYMAKNTGTRREIREFYHGIIELNYDNVFSNRSDGLIIPGDELKINYWILEEE